MYYSSYSNLSNHAVEKLLKTSLSHGLNDHEIKKRSASRAHVITYATHWFTIFFRQFKSPLIYLMLGAAIMSALLGNRLNSLIIGFIIVINTVLSFLREYRSEKTLRSLMSHLVVTAKVLRNGQEISIENNKLVIGDIIFLNPDDVIPADIRLVETDNLQINEAALSGESTPVRKSLESSNNIIFLGTEVIAGTAKGVVLATGNDTVFGKISLLTLKTPHKGSFQEKLFQLSIFLMKLTFIMIIVVIGLNIIIEGRQANILELLNFGIALAISITPEALPIISTLALTSAASKLAEQKVLIKRLSSIEDLGSITTLCADKTGTLTENKMTFIEALSHLEYDAILFGALSLPSSTDSFEKASMNALKPDQSEKIKNLKIIKEFQFDPETKSISKLIQIDSKQYILMKGAPEKVLPLCNLHEGILAEYQKWETDQELEGHRVIALVLKQTNQVEEKTLDPAKIDKGPFEFIGLLSFEDPIKSTIYDTIKTAKNLGIDIKILTGDAVAVAGAVATRIGLISSPSDVLSGDELEKLSGQQKNDVIEKCAVFARLTPQQKLDIIQTLKLNHTVGFLGDGINDAPALKIAHVGIVVQKATDVARSSADIILLKKSLITIIDGIMLGRKTFTNTVKYLKITLSSNVGNFFSLGLASFFIPYLPMLPMQLILGDFLSDSPMLSLSNDNVDAAELRFPVHYKMAHIGFFTVLFGFISTFFDFLTFAIFNDPTNQTKLQTMWFIVSLFTEIILIFSLRTRYNVLFSKPSRLLLFLSLLVTAIGVTMTFLPIGHTFFNFIRPRWSYLMIALLISLAYGLTTELVKLNYYHRRKTNHTA